jgi:hypothetical protein
MNCIFGEPRVGVAMSTHGFCVGMLSIKAWEEQGFKQQPRQPPWCAHAACRIELDG